MAWQGVGQQYTGANATVLQLREWLIAFFSVISKRVFNF